MVWANGALRPGDLAIAPSDRGLLLGDGLFETILAVGRRPVLFQEHVERLLRSAATLEFDLPERFLVQLDAAVAAVLEALPATPAALRLTVTRGGGPRGLGLPDPQAPVLLLAGAPYRAAEVRTDRAALLDAPRLDPLDPLAPHKSTSALRWVEARARARARGADLALLRTIDGDVAEADFANLFLVEADGVVVTPPLSRGVLPGVTRAWAIASLRAAAKIVLERPLEADDLTAAAEVFLSASLIGVRPLARIDDRSLPREAPCAAWLQDAYRRLAGRRA